MKIAIIRGLTGSGKTTLLNEIVTRFNYEKVEIDDLKRAKYDTTEKCNPEDDFPEAGRKAKKLADQGKNVVIEEPFTELRHLELFKKGFNDIDKYDVTYIFLETSLQTALKRKEGILKPELVKAIYNAKNKVASIKGEHIFNTDEVNIDTIVSSIEDKLN